MASRASARRYARALFDVVSKSGDVDAALVELKALGSAISGHDDLRRALTSPGVPLGAKQTVMREVLALQPVSKVVARLITLIVENDDIDEIEQIVEAFEQRVLDLHQVVRAEITSAVPLSDDKLRAIEASLADASGARVVITPRVDPAILGGVVAKVGSRVYDGSVARHLARIRTRLVSGDTLQ
ncbi:MAG: ATP synthase F1 subunit delta [Vicinamibacteraceae bacterium]